MKKREKKVPKVSAPDASDIREKYEPEVVMANWRALLEAIVHMNEAELHAALMLEISRPKAERRGDFIKRLFHKYNRLRGERELAEYMP